MTATTYQRIEKLREWVFETVCKGKTMKTPGANDRDVLWTEPKAYSFYYPRTETQDAASSDALYHSVSPSILVLGSGGYARSMEEQRFDRYNKINRPKELGKTLTVQFLFSVYDPGTREETDPESYKPLDGEGEGMEMLLNWMDELERSLVGIQSIPGTDLFVWKETLFSSPRIAENAVVDTRPTFVGMVNCVFGSFSNEAVINQEVADLLDG